MDLIATAALLVSIFTLLTTVVQIRLLRKRIEATNYQDLMQKLFSARDDVIRDPGIAKMFNENSDLSGLLDKTQLTPSDFFWLLKYLTVWENFYHQRAIGVMTAATWQAYVATLTLVFKTPKIANFWKEFRHLGTYRRDWVDFVNRICRGESVSDPKMSHWRRFLK